MVDRDHKVDKERNSREQLEHKMAETLEYGEMSKKDPDKTAAKRISPPYVVRIKAERDPILEETKLYREMAEEVDNRYDSYVKAAIEDNNDHQDNRL